MIPSLPAAWLALESDARAGVGQLQRLLLEAASLDLHAGLTRPGGLRLLAWTMTAADAAALGPLPATRGVHLDVLPGPAAGLATVRLSATATAFNDLFGWLAADLAAAASLGATAPDATRLLIDRLDAWRALLDRPPSAVLSPEAQRGLLAELLVLRDHLLPALGPAAAVAAWSGPQAMPQDFQLPGLAIEVKSSKSANRQTVRITGVRQLDPGPGIALWLVAVWLDERAAGGEIVLPAVVDALRAALAAAPAAAASFDAMLDLVGYRDDHRDRYLERSFTVSAVQLFEVADGFPRLAAESLPAAVGNVAYDLSLAACAPFQRPPSDLARALSQEPS